MNKQNIKKRIAVLSAGLVGLVAFSGIVLAQTATPAPTCSVTASPSSIAEGEAAMLEWTSTNADTATFDGGVGTTTPASGGSVSVSPAGTGAFTYTGTFSGLYGTTSCATTLTVNPVGTPISASVTPTVTIASTVTTTAAPTLTPATYPAQGTTPAPMIVQSDDTGHVLIRGAVQSVSGNVLTINSWGGIWIIRANSTSSVTPAGALGSSDTSSIRAGDFVGVDGQIAQDQLYTVDASLVRDWTLSPVAVSAGTGSAIPVTTPASSSGTTGTATPYGTLYTGTVSNTDGASSFTLTDDAGTAYTVTTDGSTALIDQSSGTIAFSSIQNGDSIRLDGTLSGSTIAATVVRDTSVAGSTSSSSAPPSTGSTPVASPVPSTGTGY